MSIYLTILLFLLVPQKNYFITFSGYIFIVAIYVMLYVIRFKKSPFILRKSLYVFFALLIMLFCFTLLRFYSYQSAQSGLKDFIDLVRFLPLFIILLILPKEYNIKKMYSAFLLFFIIDLSVSLLQFFKIQLFGIRDFIFNLYNLEPLAVWIYSYPIVRTPGIFPGFGEHGTFLGLFLFFTTYIYSITSKKIYILYIFIALMLQFITQSRSALFGLFLSFFIISILQYIYAKFLDKMKILFFGMSLLILLILIIGINKDELFYIYSIYEDGFQSSSLTARQDYWNYFISFLANNPLLIIIGAGREIVGSANSVYDNDMVFMFVTYGAIFSILFYSVFLRIIFLMLLRRTSIEHLLVVRSVLFLLISGYGLITYTQPINLIILMIFYLHFLDTNKRNMLEQHKLYEELK